MRRPLLYIFSAGLLAVSAYTAHLQWRQDADREQPLDTPSSAAVTLLHAQPFVLEEPYTHWYRAEQPEFDCGWLLVLQVPAELAMPHETLDRVLYVGEQTAERWNTGQPTGHIVVSVPSERGADGQPVALVPGQRIWFGTGELPERVDAARIAQEIELAEAARVPGLTSVELQVARQRGGAAWRGRDHHDLGYVVADLVERFSPEETEYIEMLRLTPGE